MTWSLDLRTNLDAEGPGTRGRQQLPLLLVVDHHQDDPAGKEKT
ncbi:hypothetical protein [Microlunatus flavus]|nr:hypothetical protein [Microlunatus flavus]